MTSVHVLDRRPARTFRGARRIASIFLALTLSPLNAIADEGEHEKEKHEFVGHKKCKSCHGKEAIGDQYDVWLNSKHSKAYGTLATEKAKKWGAEAGVEDPQTDEKCIKCHSTAHGVPDEMVSSRFDRTAGIQCEGCHGAGKDYRKKKIMIDRDQAIARGLLPQNEEICTSCHNDESPAWDPKRYTRADGGQVGFDYEQALKKIAHPVPEGYDPLAAGEAD
jgi:hypothetical protein